MEKIERGLAEIARLDDLVEERETAAVRHESRLGAERKRLQQGLEEAQEEAGREKVREVSRLLDRGLLSARDPAPSMCSRSNCGDSTARDSCGRERGGTRSGSVGFSAANSSVGPGSSAGGSARDFVGGSLIG